ncbi:MAG: NRAMP family divalent metal transporter [Cyclobacteriaceae bacterium]
MFKNLGPGFFVTAAFIGPGTIITCAVSGISFGVSMIWALVLGIGVTLLFQEMAARLAIINKQGLSESIVSYSPNKVVRVVLSLLVILSILVGNAAYESGNLIGAKIGLEFLLGIEDKQVLYIIVSIVFLLLLIGKHGLLEKVLVAMVFLMGIVFMVLLFISDLSSLRLDPSSQLTSNSYLISSLALIGTTVVPYNLFLHSRSIQEKWGQDARLSLVRRDLFVSVFTGGLISISILLVFAVSNSGIQVIDGLRSLTVGLETKYGPWAKYLVSLGVFSAGITSSLTAPLAASFAVSGLLDIDGKKKKKTEQATALLVLLFGTLAGFSGLKPIVLIQMAQVANALLLPILAIILMMLLNDRKLNVSQRNTPLLNLLGLVVVVFLLVLSLKSMISVLGE